MALLTVRVAAERLGVSYSTLKQEEGYKVKRIG